jgi:hypothetical protein
LHRLVGRLRLLRRSFALGVRNIAPERAICARVEGEVALGYSVPLRSEGSYARFMARRKRQRAWSLPRPLGTDHLSSLPFDDVVAALGTPHRARAALWTLVGAGSDAVEAVQRGLQSPHAEVRRGCCQFLDMHGDITASQAARALLEDPDETVRWWAAHVLTCERCTSENTWIKRQQQSR